MCQIWLNIPYIIKVNFHLRYTIPSHTYEVITQYTSFPLLLKQHELSQSKVVEKVTPVADFWMSADDVPNKNWWMCIKSYSQSNLGHFWDTVYIAESRDCCWPEVDISRILAITLLLLALLWSKVGRADGLIGCNLSSIVIRQLFLNCFFHVTLSAVLLKLGVNDLREIIALWDPISNIYSHRSGPSVSDVMPCGCDGTRSIYNCYNMNHW